MNFFLSSAARARFTDSRPQPVEIANTRWLALPANPGPDTRRHSSTSTRNSVSDKPGSISANS